MFEDKNNTESDLMMRSILEGAQEDVPEAVWERVSAELDKASKARITVLRWRRTAVGFGVAAALAVGLVLNHGDSDSLVPEAVESDMIAVVESPEPEDVMVAQVMETVRETTVPKHIEMTAAQKHNDVVKEVRMEETDVTEAMVAPDGEEPEETPSVKEVISGSTEVISGGTETERQGSGIQETEWQDDGEWEEDEAGKSRGIRTSLVFSGLAGTNGSQSTHKGNSLIRQPSISTARPKTGIKETSTNTTYGIPVSFGAGVQFGLTSKWSVGAGVNYTLLTRMFYGSYTKVDDQGSIENAVHSDIRNSQHFIGIPVNAFYSIVSNRHVEFHAYAGGTVEKCISDSYHVLGKDIIHTERPKGVQLSANVGIGVEFLIGRHLGLYIDPSLRYYFDMGQPKSIRTVQPLMLGFEMGLRVKL